MAFNTVTNLDFDNIKQSLKAYLRASDTFSDYNFEGSVLSQLIDVLSYNTYYSALNANLIANEVFFDSASIRENVVSLASLIGYTPRSSKSSLATISMDVPVSPQIGSFTLKKGESFIGSNQNGSYVFSTLDDVTREAFVDVDGIRKVRFSDINIYQGNLLSIVYPIDTSTRQSIIIPSANADVDLLTVIVNEDNVNVPLTYKKAESITGLTSTDKIYWIQENKNEQFELFFGDDTFGRKLKNNDIVTIEYIVNNQDEANKCSLFEFTGVFTFNGQNFENVTPTITVTNPSSGGALPQSITSIKYLAPRSYSAQQRAVTVRDYETLVTQLYPNLEALSIYGGEDASPPQYGKVFIAAKPFGADKMTTTAKMNLTKAIREYTILSVIPEVIDPSYIFLEVDSYVYYNNNKSRRTPQQIAEVSRIVIQKFGEENDLDRFNGKFKYSKLVSEIDSTDPGITSNITKIRIKKNMPVLSNVFASYEICYGNRISDGTDLISSGFKITGEDTTNVYYFEKYGVSGLAIFKILGGEKIYWSKNAGTIDYEKGEININAININSVVGNLENISFSVIPKSNDIIALRDLYISIKPEDVKVTTILDTISSANRTSGVGQIPVSS
jgi:hypothetical protein